MCQALHEVLGTQQALLSGGSQGSWVMSALPLRYLCDFRHPCFLICKTCWAVPDPISLSSVGWIGKSCGSRKPLWVHREHLVCGWAGEGAELGRRGAMPGPPQIFEEMHNILFIIASPVPVQGRHSEVLGGE